MNRLNVARGALAALVAAAALAGCGAGQIAQTTDQASAVNGTEGAVGELTLRDVRIQAVQSSGDFLAAGQTVDLVFVVTNQSTDSGDELTGVSTEVGKVSVTGDKKVPALGSLVVSTPARQDLAPAPGVNGTGGAERAGTATATVNLDQPITNGLTYKFTFDFKRAGRIGLAVPISAGVLTHR